jgi:hypothetical protein
VRQKFVQRPLGRGGGGGAGGKPLAQFLPGSGWPGGLVVLRGRIIFGYFFQSLYNLLRKVFGGTGILPVRVHRLKTCATFHALWVGRRPMRNGLEKLSERLSYAQSQLQPPEGGGLKHDA